ncbi:MAG TPA: NAD(P)-dependent oxidoreductase [Candidatus Paceibacterota bacterium]|nr:NAD(P)-dependent oxidoreductase [Verrucomicrobiota bacterium]HSA11424.1 NAD(P)-dependent oxidoreductase [Candidatus Paceibacterota bacterium]
MSDTVSQRPNPKYAWREVAHEGLPKRSASERVADFLEIYGLYDEATAREQASRCIQCPNPSCVTGCPLCNPIPQWMLLTAEGRFLEAAAVLGSVTNLAEICTRMCPTERLCEGSCVLNGVSEPVSIGAIEQFLAEYAFAHGQAGASTAPPNGLRVAVVGSGPGGLACADELARRGYAVTIVDSALVPGGLLVNGTPAFKVEYSIVQRRIEVLRKRGVVFRLGLKLEENLDFGQLRSEFDAVFLGFDSRKARTLQVPGADLRGVIQALPFILQKTTPVVLDLPVIEVSGKRVVVVGAGDTAMDCLRAAIRYGASEAVCVYRRAEPDMPCTRHEYDNAREEGARFVFQAAPVAVLGNDQRQVAGLRLIRTELGLADSNGLRPIVVRPGTEFDMPADLIVLALGFDRVPCPHSGELSDLAVNDWGGVTVDLNQMTSIPGVFAGGDIVRGPSLVLHAVRDARRAAQQIHAYLSERHQPARA